MEGCSFHGQILSVVEVLATAAVAEINRRVDDGCAVLRLEVSQSRRDIDLLKRKCEAMEAELRRSRMRARRKAFYPPAAERFTPLVKVMLNKDRHPEAEAPQNQPQQCANESGHVLIKVECVEEDAWANNSEDKQISEELPPGIEISPPAQTDGFGERLHSSEIPADPGSDTFPEEQQQPNGDQSEAELLLKYEREEEPDDNAAPLDSAHALVMEDGDGRQWSSDPCQDAADPGVSYAGQGIEQIPSVVPSQSGLHMEDMVPETHSVGKTHSAVASAARVKRRARVFGYRRPRPDEGHNALSQINTMGQSLTPQHPQHQCRDSAPHVRNPDEDLTPQDAAGDCFCSHGRSSFLMARRMSTPWRPGIGEKRFGCTCCDKSFVRFSQLKEHMRSHTGEKPFSCLQCGRSFTKQCNLTRHAVVHSGEKPYKCSLCRKCFTQRSSLKSHQKTAH